MANAKEPDLIPYVLESVDCTDQSITAVFPCVPTNLVCYDLPMAIVRGDPLPIVAPPDVQPFFREHAVGDVPKEVKQCQEKLCYPKNSVHKVRNQ